MAAFADRNADAERDVHDALSDGYELRRVFGYQNVRADEEVDQLGQRLSPSPTAPPRLSITE